MCVQGGQARAEGEREDEVPAVKEQALGAGGTAVNYPLRYEAQADRQ